MASAAAPRVAGPGQRCNGHPDPHAGPRPAEGVVGQQIVYLADEPAVTVRTEPGGTRPIGPAHGVERWTPGRDRERRRGPGQHEGPRVAKPVPPAQPDLV